LVCWSEQEEEEGTAGAAVDETFLLPVEVSMRRGLLAAVSLAVGLAAAGLGGCASQPLGAGSEAITLTAAGAKIVGDNARLASTPREEYIGYWTNTDTYVQWPLNHLRPGTYQVQALYSLDPQFPLSTIAVSLAGQTLTARLASTTNWDDYRALDLGTVKITAAGDETLTVKATNKPMTYVMNLQKVILTRAGG
jgi:hypothetical protein